MPFRSLCLSLVFSAGQCRSAESPFQCLGRSDRAGGKQAIIASSGAEEPPAPWNQPRWDTMLLSTGSPSPQSFDNKT
jgi:hypothetical protein